MDQQFRNIVDEQSKMLELAALILAGQDWHRLDPNQQQLAQLLTKAGYLTKPRESSGFVGSATVPLLDGIASDTQYMPPTRQGSTGNSPQH